MKKYHEQIEDTLHSFPNSYSKHEFTNELEEIANKIKKENKSCDYIDSIRKSLKGVRKEMIKVLDHSLKSNKVNKELFDILPEGIHVGIRGKQCDSLLKFHGIIQKYHDLIEKISPGELARSLVDETKILKYYKKMTGKDLFKHVQEVGKRS